MDRRGLLTGTACLGAAALAGSAAAQSAPPGREERIGRTAAETRRRLHYAGGRFSGPGYEWLVEQGKAASFFLLGEEHGIAENPRLAAQLFGDLVPSGYSRVAIEISPPMASEIDSVLAAGGIGGLKRYFSDPGSNVAFFGMREEAEWLAAARRSVRTGRPFLWGTDYEIGGDRRLIARLKSERKPAAASAALDRLDQASSRSWAEYDRTRNPQHIYSFAGDPDLVRALRSAWPRPSGEARWILDTLEVTFEINRLWVARRPWESNARRGEFMRSNFLRHWRAEARSGPKPKVFLKFGASHVMRGRNSTETFDLGALVSELAVIEGGRAFHLLVLPGVGTSVASLDPTSFTYRATPYSDGYAGGLSAILGQAYPDAFTLFDTDALRPLLGWSPTPANPELLRMVHGFDAILVMSGSTASTPL